MRGQAADQAGADRRSGRCRQDPQHRQRVQQAAVFLAQVPEYQIAGQHAGQVGSGQPQRGGQRSARQQVGGDVAQRGRGPAGRRGQRGAACEQAQQQGIGGPERGQLGFGAGQDAQAAGEEDHARHEQRLQEELACGRERGRAEVLRSGVRMLRDHVAPACCRLRGAGLRADPPELPYVTKPSGGRSPNGSRTGHRRPHLSAHIYSA